jgi:putative transposase
LSFLSFYGRHEDFLEIDLNLPTQRTTRVLDRISTLRGYPKQIRCGIGSELVSLLMADWPEDHGVHLEFTKKHKPTQNAYVERFNRTYREELLDFSIFA